MVHNLEHLRANLISDSKVQIHHVKRKANTLVDLLANHGVESGQEVTFSLWSRTRDAALWEKCRSTQEQDLRHLGCR